MSRIILTPEFDNNSNNHGKNANNRELIHPVIFNSNLEDAKTAEFVAQGEIEKEYIDPMIFYSSPEKAKATELAAQRETSEKEFIDPMIFYSSPEEAKAAEPPFEEYIENLLAEHHARMKEKNIPLKSTENKELISPIIPIDNSNETLVPSFNNLIDPDDSLIQPSFGRENTVYPDVLENTDVSYKNTSDNMPVIQPVQVPSTDIAKNSRPKVLPYHAMKKFLAREHVKIINEKIYVYKDFYYKLHSKTELARLIVDRCRADVNNNGHPRFVDDVVDFIMKEPDLIAKDEDIRKDLLTFENGVLDIIGGDFKAHTPQAVTLYSIKAWYNNFGHTPCFDNFLHTISGGDPVLIERIWQVIGYILTPDMGAKAFFLLQGVPNSGKSVLCNLLSRLIGDDAVMSLDAHVFSDKYSTSELVGKALCLSPDLPSAALDSKAVSKIKQLTGDDIVSSDVKFMSRIKFQCTAKFVFATNHPLLTKTSDDAFYDRIVTVPFRYTIPKENRTPSLIDLLLSERDAIVTKAIQAYFRLRQNGYRFAGDYPPNSVVTNETVGADLQTKIWDFAYSQFIRDDNALVFISDAFNVFTSENGEIPKKEFSQLFQKYTGELYSASQTRKRKDGAKNPTSCIMGIAWKK